jgi:hypothetical protein
MAGNVATIAATVSVVSAVVAIALGVWTARLTRQAQQVEAYRAVHDHYDKMIQLKFTNPDFLIQARDWDTGKMKCVLDASMPQHAEWSRYYTFAELCIGFANAVLQARSRHLMGKPEYKKQWERLVRLVVTEHYPIISTFLAEGPYVSEYLCNYVKDTEQRGWNWDKEHARLPW